MMKFLLFLLLCSLCLFSAHDATAGEKAQSAQNGIKCWTFGQSPQRGAALWKKGINAKDVKSRATGSRADKKTAKPEEKATGNGQFNGGLSVESQKRTWKVTPGSETARPDERRFREGRHVFRAYADMAPSDALDINIGPELIVKDDNAAGHIANSTQPDTVLGMGMNFKLDF